ncbi:MAG: T9SS type A sorting domain-containing protein [Flavobacterium sp.]
MGGTGSERANSIQQTTDGGYIVAGMSSSTTIDGDPTGNHGSGDCWIVKLSATGAIQWHKSLGGSNYDEANSILQTLDGGYIAVGNTDSFDGDISGLHGTSGYNDFWIIKLSATGAIQWQKCLGGNQDDSARSIIRTSDGGYIVTGEARSTDGDVTGVHIDCCSYYDYWVVKLSVTGTIEWQKSLGGTYDDRPSSIIQTMDGGYVVAGFTSSVNGDVTGRIYNDGDSWIVKLSPTGTIEWQKSLGGTDNDYAVSVIQTPDGGFIFAGSYYSLNGDLGNHGYFDYWIVKLNATGDLQWQKNIGGSSSEAAFCIIQSADGGLVVSGNSLSNNGDVTVNHGILDSWIVKLFPADLSNTVYIDPMLAFFPNPAKESLTVTVNFFTPSQEITITDIRGKTILNQKAQGLSTTINTSNFESGVYLLSLVDGTKKTTKKFIIE